MEHVFSKNKQLSEHAQYMLVFSVCALCMCGDGEAWFLITTVTLPPGACSAMPLTVMRGLDMRIILTYFIQHCL